MDELFPQSFSEATVRYAFGNCTAGSVLSTRFHFRIPWRFPTESLPKKVLELYSCSPQFRISANTAIMHVLRRLHCCNPTNFIRRATASAWTVLQIYLRWGPNQRGPLRLSGPAPSVFQDPWDELPPSWLNFLKSSSVVACENRIGACRAAFDIAWLWQIQSRVQTSFSLAT